MEINRISNVSVFSAMRDQWNAFVDKTHRDVLFMRHEWLLNWWTSFVDSGEMCVLTAKRGDEFIGALPLKLTSEKVRGFPATKLSFIDDSSWTAGAILVEDSDSDVIKAFAQYILKLKWDVMELRNVSEATSMEILADAMKGRHIDFSCDDGAAFPYIKPQGAWDDFFRSRSTRFRKASRNKLNKIAKRGRVDVRRYHAPEDMEEALKIIFEIGLKGWKQTINNSVSSTEGNRAFYAGIARELSPVGGVDIWVLSLDGVPIAFEYHIRNGKYIIGLVGDFDDSYKDISPGSVLDFHIMKSLFEEGGCVYNMGSGSSFYKDNWTSDSVKYKKFFFYRNSTYGKFLGFTEKKLITGLKGIRDRFSQHGSSAPPNKSRKKG